MNYSVITSRRAGKEFEDIKFQHSALLNSIRDQSLRVQQYTQQKQQEETQQKQQSETNDFTREKMTQDAQHKTMELQNKSKELEQGDREIDIMRDTAKMP